MFQRVDVGYNNFVFCEKIIGVGNPNSSPMNRLIKWAKENHRLADFTQGRKTRSVIVAEAEFGVYYILSALSTIAFNSRMDKIK
jgi:regulator of extracellular matrix RemA (YlzA/DUF370 family)